LKPIAGFNNALKKPKRKKQQHTHAELALKSAQCKEEIANLIAKSGLTMEESSACLTTLKLGAAKGKTVEPKYRLTV